MLEVGIHYCNVAGLTREYSLQACSREAATANAPDAAHPAIGFADDARHCGSSVGRIVVDENDLPIAVHGKVREALEEDCNIGPLVERRHDNAELRSGVHRRDCIPGRARRRQTC